MNTDTLWAIALVLSALTSLMVVHWAFFKILKIAKDKNLVDNPDARKLQKTPVPVMGGIAVFIGVVAGVLFGSAWCTAFTLGSTAALLPVILGMIVMLYTGAMDDIVSLTPKSRFIIEITTLLGIIFASGLCVNDLHGLWGVHEYNRWLAIAFTVFGGVGIINAINMIDGVNGLSSGLCITYCVLFGIAFLLVGDTINALLAFVVAAAIIPFFFHNVFGNHSRMFIGDAGTMMMGVLLTWFVIATYTNGCDVWDVAFGNEVNLVAMALAILSVPVFDTLRVMTMRLLDGKSPFHPDRTHLHHVFVRMSISHTITAFSEIAIDLFIVLIWVIAVLSGLSVDMQLYLVIVASVVFVWGTYFLLHWHEVHHTEFMHTMAHFGLKTHLGNKRWWQRLEHWLDGPEAKNDENEKEETTEILSGITPEQFYGFATADPDDQKEHDRKLVYGFLRNKAEVFVDDLKQRSGANPLRVDAIVSEGVIDGFITVVKEGVWGAPMIIALKETK